MPNLAAPYASPDAAGLPVNHPNSDSGLGLASGVEFANIRHNPIVLCFLRGEKGGGGYGRIELVEKFFRRRSMSPDDLTRQIDVLIELARASEMPFRDWRPANP